VALSQSMNTWWYLLPAGHLSISVNFGSLGDRESGGIEEREDVGAFLHCPSGVRAISSHFDRRPTPLVVKVFFGHARCSRGRRVLLGVERWC